MKVFWDLVFLLDRGAYRAPCLEPIKEVIRNGLKGLPDLVGFHGASLNCRVKISSFGSWKEDGGSWFSDNPFVEDFSALQTQLDGVHLDSPNDAVEVPLLDALFIIASMEKSSSLEISEPNKWRKGPGSRVVIFFTSSIYLSEMTIPEAAGGRVDDLVNAVHGRKIILFGFTPEHDCYQNLASIDKAQFEFIPTIGECPAITGLGCGMNQNNETRAIIDGFQKRFYEQEKDLLWKRVLPLVTPKPRYDIPEEC